MSSNRAWFGPQFARGFGRAWLAAGFMFLYLPMLTLVVYSFNKSALPSIWGGFTLDWYVKLAGDTEIINGLWLSIKIAFMSACCSVILGTLAAYALVKYRRFKGRTLFSGMVNAPLVMPEVIQGLSLLLLLVSVQGWTGSGHGPGRQALPGLRSGDAAHDLAVAGLGLAADLQPLAR